MPPEARAMVTQNEPATSFGGAMFATTHWSVVLQAGQSSQALERLCAEYWRPLYAFLRRQGHDAHQAKDLTQAFFLSLLERNDFALVDRERGRFRTFLIVSLKHFLANAREREQTQKRGGHIPHLALELLESEEYRGSEPADHLTPDQVYDRQWALSLLDTVLRHLQGELQAAGKGHLFERLCPLLTGEKSQATYAELAQEFGLTESAVKVTVHRMRQRYREMLREEVGRTVSSPNQIEDELSELIAVLRQ